MQQLSLFDDPQQEAKTTRRPGAPGWTEAEDAVIIELAHTQTAEQIAERLHRTKGATAARRDKLRHLGKIPAIGSAFMRRLVPSYIPPTGVLLAKSCTGCGEFLPADAFFKTPQVAGGRIAMCKVCKKAQVCSVSCAFEGCDKPRHANGYCTGHNQQRADGRPLIPLRSIHDRIGYSAAHGRCRQLWRSASQYGCCLCPPDDPHQAKDWAYLGGDSEELYTDKPNKLLGFMPYSRYPEFYGPACGPCHRRKDAARLQEEYELLAPQIRALYMELKGITPENYVPEAWITKKQEQKRAEQKRTAA